MRCNRLHPALGCVLLVAGCGSGAGPAPRITGTEVVVSTTHMDVTFARQDPFEDTYMVFGGLAMDRADAISKITVVGLSMEDARPIYDRYPDFTQCKSQGAMLAQRAVRQMDIVPADDGILEELKQTLAEHESSLREGGDRVCVKLRGELLQLASATAEDQDVTHQLPPQVKHDYYLVRSAELVDASAALGGY